MELFLSTQVIIYLFSEALLFLLAIISTIGSIMIVKKWNFNSTSTEQYNLEKRSYLIALIIFFTLIFKILLLPYFVYTIDELSSIIPGAMCGAGVIGANEYGNPLLILKIVILFLIGIWLIINNKDLQAPNYPYFKKKFGFFIVIFLLMSAEMYLDLAYFFGISLKEPVFCCSVIFGLSGDNSLFLGLNLTTLLILFYLLALLNIALSYQKNSISLFISSIAFLVIAYFSINHFFGTYIYQLPTHKCPFCMLQKEYYYVGYLLWSLLFLATFFGISNFLLKQIIDIQIPKLFNYAIYFNLSFIVLCSAYPIGYFIKNGVWL